MESEDFEGNFPDVKVESVTPKFNILRPASAKRLSLVIDTSGSMNGDRLPRLRQVADLFLQNIAKSNFQVSLVEFHSWAKKIRALTHLQDAAEIKQFLNDLPMTAFGGSCLGCGIRKAIRTLTNKDKSKGGDIVVFTDGDENLRPGLSDLNNILVRSKSYRLHAVFLSSRGGDKLKEMVELSGGSWLDAHNSDVAQLSGDLYHVVRDNVNYEGTDDVITTIYHKSWSLSTTDVASDDLYIDENSGSNFLFTLTWYSSGSLPEITLFDPDQCQYNSATKLRNDFNDKSCPQLQIVADRNNKVIRFVSENKLKKGHWFFVVTSSRLQHVTLTVTTSSFSSENTVRVTPYLRRENSSVVLTAKVTKNSFPVNEVKVLAEVTDEDEAVQYLELEQVEDINLDGYYSTSFETDNMKGKFSILIRISGYESALEMKSYKHYALYNYGHIEPDETIVINYNGKMTKNKPTEKIESGNKFQRIFFYDKLAVELLPPTNDVRFDYGEVKNPENIKDLKVIRKSTSGTNDEFVLKFTSPKVYSKKQRASRYEICYVHEQFPLSKICLENSLLGNLFAPKIPGERESFLISIPKLQLDSNSERVAFTVNVYDENPSSSSTSNTAYISMLSKIKKMASFNNPYNNAEIKSKLSSAQLKAIKRKTIMCLTCNDARTEDECREKGRLQTCPRHMKSCATTIRRGRDDQIRITKFCKETDVCRMEKAQNKLLVASRSENKIEKVPQCSSFARNSICRCCCQSSRCNLQGNCLDDQN